MVEISFIELAIVFCIMSFSFVVTAYFWSVAKVEALSAARWRSEYETLNAKVRPEFQAAVDHFIPRSEPAAKRIERLRKALEQ